MRKVIKYIYDFIIEWELLTIIVTAALVGYSYPIIKTLFKDLPWDQRMNPGVDSFIYYAQALCLFFISIAVVWWWLRRNVKPLTEVLSEEFLATAIEAAKGHNPLRTLALGITFFLVMLYILSQFFIAVT